MFANDVGKEAYGDRFLGQERCNFCGFFGTRHNCKLGKVLPNLEQPQTSNTKQASGKVELENLLIHDNARPHTANRTREVLESFKWELFPHPPYSPDLAPSDYHLFPTMKKWLATQRFEDDAELQQEVNNWLKTQAAEFYEEGIVKLIKRYDKCLNLNGDYVEK
jgi:[histone H3]-lysine36 N-dimethyltransferase SETMAR